MNKDFNEKVSVALISCGRRELLEKTIDSFSTFNTYPIEKFIIIDDSQNSNFLNEVEMSSLKNNNLIKELVLINDGINKNQYYRIDEAYNNIETEYLFHSEDDWEFLEPDFIKNSLNILRDNRNIFLVNLYGYEQYATTKYTNMMKLHDTEYECGESKFKLVDKFSNNLWHGFTLNPSLRRLSDYKKLAPYSNFMPGNIAMIEAEKEFLLLWFHGLFKSWDDVTEDWIEMDKDDFFDFSENIKRHAWKTECIIGKRYRDMGIDFAVIDKAYHRHIGEGYSLMEEH